VRKVLGGDDRPEPGEALFAFECDGARLLEYSLHRFVESESGRPGVVMVLRDVTRQREFDKLRSEFVMRASHELRTPITSVRMGVDLLRSKLDFAPGSREAELYDTIQHELQRMVALLTDLLDLSRMRAGAHIIQRLPVEVNEMLGDAQRRFTAAAAEARVGLDVRIEAGVPRVSLCRSAFDRVLDNLIANALRHTPAGGTIRLDARRHTDQVVIEIKDTGEGVPYALQSSIFEPFVQGGGKRGGAGLGLAICKEIVQQHGGAIRVASLPGQGAVFTISLAA
jgi:NtrC-family two-component system sensor histidine kinase KinB